MKMLSHPAEKNTPEKPLVEHLLQVATLSARRIDGMKLDLTIVSKRDLSRLSFLIGLFHDFGKATSFFQNYIRTPGRRGSHLTHHSFVSAAVAYTTIKTELDSELLAIAAFRVIKRHHGNLEAFDNEDSSLKRDIAIAKDQLQDIQRHYKSELEDFFAARLERSCIPWTTDFSSLPENLDDWEDIAEDDLGDGAEERIEFFFVVNLLFSLLVDHDKKDAARLDSGYYEGNLDEPFPRVFDYIEHLRRQYPGKFDPTSPINARRQEFLKAVSENDAIDPDQRFYTITAPTGIGKTYGCLAFARALMDAMDTPAARVIYCLPYTSIIDQNFAVFEEIMRFHHGERYTERPGRYIMKHHYLEPKPVDKRVDVEEYRYKDYLDDVLLVESWESAMVVTTFVQFFHSLVGHKNRMLKKFHRIVNSIVILDEIQNVSPHYYKLLQKVLDVLGRRFNTWFLLVTATQPEIFAPSPMPPRELAASIEAMDDPLFNRVKLTVDIAPQPLTGFLERFVGEFVGPNCLMILNTRESAQTAYRHIQKELPRFQVFCLTTNLVPRDRKEKIKAIAEALTRGEAIIVVSTQLVEAGVDLSFKNVYRDFGPLDSIVQAAGRCNRHGEYGPLGGLARLVCLQDEARNLKEFHAYIYESIIGQMVRATLMGGEYEARQFADLSRRYFGMFDFQRESNLLLKGICDLNYDREAGNQTPVSKFQLIEEYNDEELYVLTTLDAQRDMDRLREAMSLLTTDELSPEERDETLLQIEGLKIALREYRLSFRSSELKAYADSRIIEGLEYFKYISYENQQKYAYDPDTGFLKSPKQELSNAAIF